MKNTASILGIIGGVITIIGTLFKVMHWPGVGVLLPLGLAITALLFMPTALAVIYRSKEGIKDRAAIIAGFTGGTLLIIFALLKIMHWPGASLLLIIALSELIFIFTPLHFIKSYRNPENRWFDIGSLTVIMASLILVLTLYSFHGPSNGYIESIKNLEQQTIDSYRKLDKEIYATSQQVVSEHPDKKENIIVVNKITRLLSQCFYQYRNQLLAPNSQQELDTFNNTLGELKSLNMDGLENWPKLLKQLNHINQAKLFEKHMHVARAFEIYPKLISEILDISLNEESLLVIHNSMKGLPVPNKIALETNLLYVNFLNLAEFEMRRYQLRMIQSV